MASTDSISAEQLSATDLRSHPIWQFRMDAEGNEDVDESHVTPSAAPLALGSFGSYIVAATYGLKNGANLPGSVQVDVLGQKVHFTPAVVYAKGKAVDALAHDAELRLARITQTSNTRPLNWQLAVPFHGERAVRRGRIAKSTFGKAMATLVQLFLLRLSGRRR
ncbi:MAG: hypothetical protein ABL931_10155 [Usitatibacteraceae bacterium]